MEKKFVINPATFTREDLVDPLAFIATYMDDVDDSPLAGDALVRTIAAWIEYARHHDILADENGCIEGQHLVDFDYDFVCAVTDHQALTDHWVDHGWELDARLEGGPTFDSLTVIATAFGLAAFR